MRMMQETIAGQSLIKPLNTKSLVRYALGKSSKYVNATRDYKKICKIMTLYFKIMWKAVLNGYEWSIPNTMTIRIVRKVQLHPRRWHNKSVHKKKNEFMQNKRSGFYYEIKMDCPEAKNQSMKLKAAKTPRYELNEILNNTDKEYILIDEKL